jgi:cyclopropane fatty-acyl-phospholipid synthase-like methyltransferase
LPYMSANNLPPWQSFPAGALYASFGAVAWASAAFSHACLAPYVMKNVQHWCQCTKALVHTACIAGGVPLLSMGPCAMLFVGFVYWHSKASSSASRKHDRGGADCTRFVRFKDPGMQARYKDRRIDMETLYEMYFDGELDFVNPSSPGSAECCLWGDVLSRRHEFVAYTFGLTTHLRFLLMKWIPDVLSHSRSQDVLQVRDHYDMAKNPFTGGDAEDDFFGMFLGKRMVYTSGIASPKAPCSISDPALKGCSEGSAMIACNEGLEALQDNKIRLICKKLRLAKGQTHLDIGCGWGTLVNHSASMYGTIATGVTLSRNQVAYATAVSRKMGIQDHRTTFWCMDYRDIPTNVGVQYDKVSCIEMAEHVGIKNFQGFLRQVGSLLKDDGTFLLQIAGLRRPFQVGT